MLFVFHLDISANLYRLVFLLIMLWPLGPVSHQEYDIIKLGHLNYFYKHAYVTLPPGSAPSQLVSSAERVSNPGFPRRRRAL